MTGAGTSKTLGPMYMLETLGRNITRLAIILLSVLIVSQALLSWPTAKESIGPFISAVYRLEGREIPGAFGRSTYLRDN